MVMPVCWVCFSSDVRLMALKNADFRHLLETTNNLEMLNLFTSPCQLCWRCCAQLKRVIAFKKLCAQSFPVLLECVIKHENVDAVRNIVADAHAQLPQLVSLECSRLTDVDLKPDTGDWDVFEGEARFVVVDNHPNKVERDEESPPGIKKESPHVSSDSDDDVPLVQYETIFVSSHREFNDDSDGAKKVKRRKPRKSSANSTSDKFDLSSVIVSSLSKSEQIEEMNRLRTESGYLASPYKCELCAKGFSNETMYNVHVARHEPISGDFVCGLCTLRFKNNTHLITHVNSHVKRYTCQFCGKIFKTKLNIACHLSTEHGQVDKILNCEQCNKTFSNRYTYAKHQQYYHSKNYTCHICSKVSRDKSNLNRHMLTHQNNPKHFQCNTCSKAFPTKSQLKCHLLVHMQSREFHCVKCNLSYATQVQLNFHMRMGARHVKPELLKFECNLCDRRYLTKRRLVEHQNHIHLNKRISCTWCDSTFAHQSTLNVHVRTVHEGQKPVTNKEHICDICGKCYQHKASLKMHMNIHTGEKPYTCKYCDAKFSNSGTMYTHINTAHPEDRTKSDIKLQMNSGGDPQADSRTQEIDFKPKSYKCDTCSRVFTTKQILKTHQLTHVESKEFYCVECNLAYATQSQLNLHLRKGARHVQPDQLKFKCTMCDKRYLTKRRLINHQNYIHLNKRISCNFCDGLFAHEVSLNTHIRTVHEGQKNTKDWICDICGKCFQYKTVLKAHMNRHTGEKPHSCMHCSARFSDSGSLYKHTTMVHLKLKPDNVRRKRERPKKDCETQKSLEDLDIL